MILTNLYNERRGWREDPPDEEVLKDFLALNRERYGPEGNSYLRAPMSIRRKEAAMIAIPAIKSADPAP